MQIMEIIAPHGSVRLESFPPFEEYKPNYQYDYLWTRLSPEDKLERYSKYRHKVYIHQCQGVKAFMKQHKVRRNRGISA